MVTDFNSKYVILLRIFILENGEKYGYRAK